MESRREGGGGNRAAQWVRPRVGLWLGDIQLGGNCEWSCVFSSRGRLGNGDVRAGTKTLEVDVAGQDGNCKNQAFTTGCCRGFSGPKEDGRGAVQFSRFCSLLQFLRRLGNRGAEWCSGREWSAIAGQWQVSPKRRVKNQVRAAGNLGNAGEDWQSCSKVGNEAKKG